MGVNLVCNLFDIYTHRYIIIILVHYLIHRNKTVNKKGGRNPGIVIHPLNEDKGLLVYW